MAKFSFFILLLATLQRFSVIKSQEEPILKSLIMNFVDQDDELLQNPKVIIGGHDTEQGRYPYMVALMNANGNFPNCGASLIAPRWIVSAAHCFGSAGKVQIGRHDYTNDDDDYEEIDIKQVIIHPRYRSGFFNNDVMLIELEWDSTFTPVKVDDGSIFLAPGTDLTTMGFGAISNGGLLSKTLREVELDYFPRILCSIPYLSVGGVNLNMMCARRSGKDACQGDSGGPLIIKGQDASEDIQVGIVSWGFQCALRFFPGVFSRLGSLSINNFIEDHVTFD